MKTILSGILLLLFFSSSVYKKEEPILTRLTVKPCKQFCDAPEAILTNDLKGSTLKLLFAINRNCGSIDTIRFQLVDEVLTIETLRNRRFRQDYDECDCLLKYELEIANVYKKPKQIMVNGYINHEKIGFIYPSALAKALPFMDSVEKSKAFPLNKPFLLPGVSYDKGSTYSKFPAVFVKYLELNQYLKIELEGIVTKDEAHDAGLAFKRSMALRGHLVGKNEVCINRVVLNDSAHDLSKHSIGEIAGIRVRLTKASTFAQLPNYYKY